MSIAYEQEQIAALIGAHQATLFQLQLKQAKMGSAAPATLANEIADVEKAIERLTERPVEMTPREAHLVNYQMWMRIESNQINLAREVSELRHRVNQMLDALAIQGIRAPAKQPRAAPSKLNGGD